MRGRERDHHVGTAEPNQGGEQAWRRARPQKNYSACHIRVGLECRCCRLCVIAFRLCIVECQPAGPTAASHGSACASTANRYLYAGRYPVDPETTSCLAARDQLFIAPKRRPARARVIYGRVAAAEHYGRTSRREEHFSSDRGPARRRQEDE